MRRLLSTIVLLAALVAGFGWYRGWFDVTTSHADDGKPTLNVTVDKDKIHDDKVKVKETVKDVAHEVKEVVK
jgi:hypothetical protein